MGKIGISYSESDLAIKKLKSISDEISNEIMSVNSTISNVTNLGIKYRSSVNSQVSKLQSIKRSLDTDKRKVDALASKLQVFVEKVKLTDSMLVSAINSGYNSYCASNKSGNYNFEDNYKAIGGPSLSGASDESGDNEGYLKKSFNQFIYGNFTDDVTLLGTGAQIGAGLLGVDLPADIRDISADFVNWKWSWGHAGQTVLDMAGILPIVGGLKYTDEVAKLAKNSDEIVDSVKDIEKVGKDIVKEQNKSISHEWQAYFDDIENSTGRKLTQEQKDLVIEEINSNPHDIKLTGQDYKDHRTDFNNQKDDLITQWAQNTDQTWPTYENDVISKKGNVYIKEGDKYDAHEIIPNVYDSPLEWWNLHPAARPGEHQGGIHGSGGAIKDIFK